MKWFLHSWNTLTFHNCVASVFFLVYAIFIKLCHFYFYFLNEIGIYRFWWFQFLSIPLYFQGYILGLITFWRSLLDLFWSSLFLLLFFPYLFLNLKRIQSCHLYCREEFAFSISFNFFIFKLIYKISSLFLRWIVRFSKNGSTLLCSNLLDIIFGTRW